MHLSVGIHSALGQGTHRIRLADIGLNRQHLVSIGFQGARCRLEGASLHIGHHDLHPLGGQALAKSPTDPAGSAGDHRNTSVQLFHRILPLEAGPERRTRPAECECYTDPVAPPAQEPVKAGIVQGKILNREPLPARPPGRRQPDPEGQL
jgi:hypothetical protein